MSTGSILKFSALLTLLIVLQKRFDFQLVRVDCRDSVIGIKQRNDH